MATVRRTLAGAYLRRIPVGFGPLHLDISADVTRADFETWIAADIERIGAAIDVALKRADVTVETVNSVLHDGRHLLCPRGATVVRTAL